MGTGLVHSPLVRGGGGGGGILNSGIKRAPDLKRLRFVLICQENSSICRRNHPARQVLCFSFEIVIAFPSARLQFPSGGGEQPYQPLVQGRSQRSQVGCALANTSLLQKPMPVILYGLHRSAESMDNLGCPSIPQASQSTGSVATSHLWRAQRSTEHQLQNGRAHSQGCSA